MFSRFNGNRRNAPKLTRTRSSHQRHGGKTSLLFRIRFFLALLFVILFIWACSIGQNLSENPIDNPNNNNDGYQVLPPPSSSSSTKHQDQHNQNNDATKTTITNQPPKPDIIIKGSQHNTVINKKIKPVSAISFKKSKIKHQMTSPPLQDTRENKNKILDIKLNDTNSNQTKKLFNLPKDQKVLPSLLHLKLRFDWTRLQLYSPIAKLMQRHQSDCSLPVGDFFWRKKVFGLGSDLHVWGAALCNAIEEKRRIRTHDMNPWVWVDRQHCDNHTVERTTMGCYFPHVEMTCPQDVNEPSPPLEKKEAEKHRYNIANPIHIKCDRNETSPMNIYNKTEWRAAGAEYLFSQVSPMVVQEAERQLRLVFSSPLSLSSKKNPTLLNAVPKDLIVVHVRWGDKKFENKLELITTHFAAMERIRIRRGDNLRRPVSVLLCTEDPLAVDAFVEEAMKQSNHTRKPRFRRHYIIYVDQFYRELLPHRPDDPDMYNTVPKTSRALDGRAGLWSLGSLLVAMEANAFVFTLASNWSRLMNELRKNVLNPRCGNCTLMEDVSRGKYKEW